MKLEGKKLFIIILLQTRIQQYSAIALEINLMNDHEKTRRTLGFVTNSDSIDELQDFRKLLDDHNEFRKQLINSKSSGPYFDMSQEIVRTMSSELHNALLKLDEAISLAKEAVFVEGLGAARESLLKFAQTTLLTFSTAPLRTVENSAVRHAFGQALVRLEESEVVISSLKSEIDRLKGELTTLSSGTQGTFQSSNFSTSSTITDLKFKLGASERNRSSLQSSLNIIQKGFDMVDKSNKSMEMFGEQSLNGFQAIDAVMKSLRKETAAREKMEIDLRKITAKYEEQRAAAKVLEAEMQLCSNKQNVKLVVFEEKMDFVESKRMKAEIEVQTDPFDALNIIDSKPSRNDEMEKTNVIVRKSNTPTFKGAPKAKKLIPVKRDTIDENNVDNDSIVNSDVDNNTDKSAAHTKLKNTTKKKENDSDDNNNTQEHNLSRQSRSKRGKVEVDYDFDEFEDDDEYQDYNPDDDDDDYDGKPITKRKKYATSKSKNTKKLSPQSSTSATSPRRNKLINQEVQDAKEEQANDVEVHTDAEPVYQNHHKLTCDKCKYNQASFRSRAACGHLACQECLDSSRSRRRCIACFLGPGEFDVI